VRSWPRPLRPTGRQLIVTALLLIYSVLVTRWLAPGLGQLTVPATIYAGAITAMAVTTIFAGFSRPFVCIGAILFMISDSLIAAARFKTGWAPASYLIWPTYYLGQYRIAIGFLREGRRRRGPRLGITPACAILRPSGCEMKPLQTCPRCAQAISLDETVEFDGARVVHFDCRRPRSLSREERVLLSRYCTDHAVGRCVSCSLSYRQHQLGSDVFGHDTRLCPRCRKDLTNSVRAHLYACTMLPSDVRRRARKVRNVALGLIKRSHELIDRADLQMRVAEVASQPPGLFASVFSGSSETVTCHTPAFRRLLRATLARNRGARPATRS